MPSVLHNAHHAIWGPLPIGSTGASGSTRSRHACSWPPPLSGLAQALGFSLLKYLANEESFYGFLFEYLLALLI
jgi:hypothetical protein